MAKLYPHQALEAIENSRRRYDAEIKQYGLKDALESWQYSYSTPYEQRHTLFNSLSNSLRSCAVFDFGSLVDIDPVHVEFACQMFEHNDFTKFSPFCLVIQTGDKMLPQLHMIEPGHKKGVIYTNLFLSPDKEIIILGTVIDGTMAMTEVDGVAMIGVKSARALRVTPPTCMNLTPEQFKEQMQTGLTATMARYAMMSCREVEKVTVPAPVKLNKARANAHKPLIADRTEIKINLSTPALQVEYQTPASPRHQVL
jgi:hypothetical protein